MELKKQMFGFRRRLQPISSSKKMIVTADHEREESYPDMPCNNRNISRSHATACFSHLFYHASPLHLSSHLYPGAQSLQQQVRLINISGNPNGAPPGRSLNKIPGYRINKPLYQRFE